LDANDANQGRIAPARGVGSSVNELDEGPIEGVSGRETLPALYGDPWFVTENGDPYSPDSGTKRGGWVGVVDDDASVRCALARALRANGIRVEAFASAEDFLQRVTAGEPECLVVDIQLEGLSGFELQEVLNARGESLPIVFITARVDLIANQTRGEGVCGYLRKPFDTSLLIALLRSSLGSSLTD